MAEKTPVVTPTVTPTVTAVEVGNESGGEWLQNRGASKPDRPEYRGDNRDAS